jgi:hypothetical protein
LKRNYIWEYVNKKKRLNTTALYFEKYPHNFGKLEISADLLQNFFLFRPKSYVISKLESTDILINFATLI